MRKALLLGLIAIALRAADRPIPVKVVVVTMFEIGADTGDAPGEFQDWVEREKLDRVFPFPQGYHDLRMNDKGVLGIVTGAGASRAAASIMALGLDPRFDLTKAYWVVAGIAGVDPADASIGSAAWAEWIVDGDHAYDIDSREIPKDWKTGYVPMGKRMPYEQPRADGGEVFHLNPGLVEWAYQLTRSAPLEDSAGLKQARSGYASENAHRAPLVLKGDVISSSTFWYGKLRDQWANEWMRYHTGGMGNFVMTAMEDAGTLQSLTFLAKAGRVDFNRVLILRTASNYDQAPSGMDSAAGFAVMRGGGSLPGFAPAIEAAWRIGHVVVEKLLDNWSTYRDRIPSDKR